jgi:hypothetical protein
MLPTLILSYNSLDTIPHLRYDLSEHDDGAGQEKTVEAALIHETDRARIPQGRAQKQSGVMLQHNGR